MSRPPLEVADLIRTAGAALLERNRQWNSWKHIKVLLAIARCRTAALGAHLDQCTRCRHQATSPTTAAGTATARSVRPLSVKCGLQHIKENFSRRASSKWSSHYPTGWCQGSLSTHNNRRPTPAISI